GAVPAPRPSGRLSPVQFAPGELVVPDDSVMQVAGEAGVENGQQSRDEDTIESAGAPSDWTAPRLSRSAPIRVPKLPLMYARGAARRRVSATAMTAVATAGTNIGSAMPKPATGCAR